MYIYTYRGGEVLAEALEALPVLEGLVRANGEGARGDGAQGSVGARLRRRGAADGGAGVEEHRAGDERVVLGAQHALVGRQPVARLRDGVGGVGGGGGGGTVKRTTDTQSHPPAHPQTYAHTH